jgi:hypothetical protein
MIIQNGHIRFLKAEGGGLDKVTGHPVPPTEEEMGPRIPCQYQAARMNLLAMSNGEHAVSESFTILVENYIPVLGERLVLYGRGCKEVGKFSVMRVEPLDAVCQVRITV